MRFFAVGLCEGHRVPDEAPGDCKGDGRPPWRAGQGQAYGNLGNVYRSQGHFTKAIAYHGQHLAIVKEVGDRAGEGAAYANLGTCHMHLNEYDKAVAYFEAQHALATSLKLACSPTQRSTWASPSPFTSGQLARALLLSRTKLLDRIVTRRHRRA